MAANAGKPTIYVQSMSNNQAQWLAKQHGSLMNALKIMGNSILAQARTRAPKAETENLRNSGKVQVQKDGVIVSFGSAQVPYGSYQERGERYDRTHKVKRYTTPNTGKDFLASAGKNVTEEGIDKWLRSAF